MGQILLVGNGFTSQLIPEYQNANMMKLYAAANGDILAKANRLFQPLRVKADNIEIYSIAAGVAGAPGTVAGGHPILTPIIGTHMHPQFVKNLENILESLGFSDCEMTVKTYFETYSLLHETQNNEICSIECLLKVIDLFQKVGEFDIRDVESAESIANKIYYNDGNFRGENVNPIIHTKLKNWFDSYSELYTTNYDLVLDDLSERPVFHLHGGFDFLSRKERAKQPVSYDKALLIWGISAEAKKSRMQRKAQFSPQILPMVFEYSLFESYLGALGRTEANSIHVFGYSGENDQHINDAIAGNHNIKEVIYYCSPRDTDPYGKKMAEVRRQFDVNQYKNIKLKPWDEVWSKIT